MSGVAGSEARIPTYWSAGKGASWSGSGHDNSTSIEQYGYPPSSSKSTLKPGFKQQPNARALQKADEDFESFATENVPLDHYYASFLDVQAPGNHSPESMETGYLNANISAAYANYMEAESEALMTGRAKSKAAQRLGQIENHLAAFHSGCVSLQKLSCHQYDTSNQFFSEIRTNVWQTPIENSLAEQNDLESHGNQQQTSTEEYQEDDYQLDFHCPYIDCHRYLAEQSLQANSSSSKRDCVHVGCPFVSTAASEWVEHVSVPHHDLQATPKIRGQDN